MNFKPFILSVIALICTCTGMTQGLEWQWVKKISGDASVMADFSATDDKGYIYLGGRFFGTTMTIGDITLKKDYPKTCDAFIAKYDSNGNVIWARSFGGKSFEYSGNIVLDKKGHFYVSGTFYSDTISFGSIGIKHAANDSTSDIFIAKFDTAGNAVWAKAFGSNDFDYPASLTADKNGDIYITGGFSGSIIQFGRFSLSKSIPNRATDIFLTKLDPEGNTIWSKKIAGSTTVYPETVLINPEGHLILTGHTESSYLKIDTLSITDSTHEIDFIISFDTSGRMLWIKEYPNFMFLGASHTICDALGNLYMEGYFDGSNIEPFHLGKFSLESKGDEDVFLAKFDKKGNIIWARSFGGLDFDYEGPLLLDSFNNLYAVSTFNSSSISFGTSKIENAKDSTLYHNTSDILMMRWDTAGVLHWAKSTGGKMNEYSGTLSLVGKNRIFIAGVYNSSEMSFNSIVLTDTSTKKFFNGFIALSERTDFSKEALSLKIYPNPSKGVFSVELKNGSSESADLEIYDVSGRKVYLSSIVENKANRVNISDLSAGIYFVLARDNDGIYTGKILKE